MNKNTFILAFFFFSYFNVYGQHNFNKFFDIIKEGIRPMERYPFRIDFDSTGLISRELPILLLPGDKIYFKLLGTKEQLLKSTLYEKFRNYHKNLPNADFDKLSENQIFKIIFPQKDTFEIYKSSFDKSQFNEFLKIDSIYNIKIKYLNVQNQVIEKQLNFFHEYNGYVTSHFIIPNDIKLNEITFFLFKNDIDIKILEKVTKQVNIKSWQKFDTLIKDKISNIARDTVLISKLLIEEEFSKKINSKFNFADSLNKKIFRIQDSLIIINKALKDIVTKPNISAMKNWLWFTGLSKPNINPIKSISFIDSLLFLKIENLILKKTEILNTHKFYISKPESIIWQPQYDAKNNYNTFQNKNEIPNYIGESDEMRPIVINLMEGENVNLSENGEKYIMESVISKFAKNMSTQITNLTSFNATYPLSLKIRSMQIDEAILVKQNNYLKTYKNTLELVNWYKQQYYLNINYSTIQKPKTLLHSDWPLSSTTAEKSAENKITYNLKFGDKLEKSTSNSYYIYKPVRFVPFVGIGIIPEERNSLEFNTATKSFKENSRPNHFDVIAGTKWYPVKGMNQTRTKKRAAFTKFGFPYQNIRGNGLCNRFSINAGLGLNYQILRNYFAGIGFDLLPGLNINGGYNFYFQKSYLLKNGEIEKEYDNLTGNKLYFSIVTDLSVFKTVAQLINPFSK